MRTTIVTKFASAVATISMLALTTGSAHAAGTASLSINGGSYQQGATFTATVRETSTDPVVSVQADLTYDATKLECLGVDGGASAFTIPYQGTCGGGAISIARTTAGTTLTGTQTVATVTFRALAGAGNSAISFKATSGIYRSPDAVNVWDGNTAGAGIAFTSAPVATPVPTAAPKAATPAPTAKPTITATPTPTVMAAATEVTPTPSPTPMEGQAEAEPTVAPKPSASDSTRAISNTTIGSILAVVAAGAAALYVVRRVRDIKA